MVLRPIDYEPFIKPCGTLPALDAGKQPYLQWLRISQLVVDGTYQRDILETGRRNVIRIAREFDWARFATVVVAPSGKDKYVIIDGQHRTTAAALRGLEKVPCQIVVADLPKQALAFAAINANVTKMSTMQLHAARVAANDPDALRLKKVCAAGGVTLLRYPVQATKQKVGETMTVVQLRQALDRYGEKALRTALLCITKTRGGNPGMIRGLLVLALCSVLESEPKWLNNSNIIGTFERFDFPKAFKDAGHNAGGFSQAAVKSALIESISSFLTKQIGAKAA
jgi:hypothetical protein